jgi:hypothetical protein
MEVIAYLQKYNQLKDGCEASKGIPILVQTMLYLKLGFLYTYNLKIRIVLSLIGLIHFGMN